MKQILGIILLVMLASRVGAQELPQGDQRNDAFRQHMTTIQSQNKNIRNFNAMLPEAEYKLPDGGVDRLKDGDKNGIWGREFAKWYGISYGDFLHGEKPLMPSEGDKNASSTILNWESPKIVTASTPWPWFMIPLLLTLGILLYLAQPSLDERMRRWAEKRERGDEAARTANILRLREQELSQNPVTSGPPIVANGIPATDTDRLAEHFQDRAVTQCVRSSGASITEVAPDVVRVGPIEEGMISGEGIVGYADRARPRRVNPPMPGYRATFRFPDGSEQQLMSLQACMNPCVWGEGMSGFTFTARNIAVPTPEPERPAPQPAPHPAIAVARIRAAAETEDASTILVGGEMVTIRQGAHFDLDRNPGSVVISGGTFEMTVKKIAVAERTASSEHTGT